MLIQQFFAFGFIGLLLENVFTGLWSVFHGDKRATTTSYLWMLPIYGFGGLQMMLLHSTGWHILVLAAIDVIIIYANEFAWGWALDKILGKCPWDYGKGRHTIMGYIRFDYAFYWFGVGLGFELCIDYVQKALRVINTVL